MTSRPLASLLVLALLVGCNQPTRVSRVNRAPEVLVTAPEAEQLFRKGEGDIDLLAEVSDSYDPVGDLVVTWTIDAGEPLAATVSDEGLAAAIVSPDDLELGSHDALVTVVDTDGATATAGVRFVIAGPYGAPTVEITTPEDGITVDAGTAVTFRGEATDVTSGPEDLIFDWSSDLDGALGGEISAGGESIVLATALSAGTHTITLSVTDADFEVGEDSILVHVIAEKIEPQPGDLVFSEFMVNPNVVQDEVGEWVELYNTSGFAIDVDGYTFHDDDNDSWELEGPLVVGPGEYLVLCADMDPNVNGGVPCDGWFLRDYQGNGLALANNPDELVLSRPDGLEIDWVHYESDWFQAGAASGVDPSQLEGGSNDYKEAWCIQTTVITSGGEPGTPGQENDICPTE